ncbi:MAG TPA: MBL fold metallo-hydrolase, partial [Sphingomonas sp.]|nr:MBL fold metallo-hydrolase [Sphingomonas sp.]
MGTKPTYSPVLSGNSMSVTGNAYPNGNPDIPYNLPGVRNTDSAVPLHRTTPVTHVYSCEGP